MCLPPWPPLGVCAQSPLCPPFIGEQPLPGPPPMLFSFPPQPCSPPATYTICSSAACLPHWKVSSLRTGVWGLPYHSQPPTARGPACGRCSGNVGRRVNSRAHHRLGRGRTNPASRSRVICPQEGLGRGTGSHPGEGTTHLQELCSAGPGLRVLIQGRLQEVSELRRPGRTDR